MQSTEISGIHYYNPPASGVLKAVHVCDNNRCAPRRPRTGTEPVKPGAKPLKSALQLAAPGAHRFPMRTVPQPFDRVFATLSCSTKAATSVSKK